MRTQNLDACTSSIPDRFETMYSDEQLRLIIDTIPILAWCARPDGSAEFFNQRWLAYTGLSAEQALHWGWKGAIHSDDLPRVMEVFQKAVSSGQPFEIEIRLRRKDGEFRWCLVRGIPLHDAYGNIVRWYGTNTDIQDRKCAEDTLQARERSLRLIVETIPGFVWTMNSRGEVELVSQQMLEYFGKTLEEVRDWTSFLHPEERAHVVAFWRKTVEEGEAYEVDHRLRRADGVYRWFHGRGRPLLNAEGHVDRWYNLLTDIDDRKRAEEALRHSEERFRLVVDSIAGHIHIMTPKGELEFVNKRGLDYLGKTLKELKDWRTNDTVHPDDLPRVVAAWKHSVETGNPYDVDHRLRRADGVYRWFHSGGLSLRDAQGRILRWYILLTDIEDRETAQEKLRSSEAYLSEAQKLSRTGSFGWDVASGEIYWSAETFRIFEYEPSTKITIELILQRVHPDDRSRPERVIEQASSEQRPFDLEHRLLMPNGSIKHVHVVGRPWRNQFGRLEFVGAVTDITELKLAHEKLRCSEESLLEAQRISHMGSFRHHIQSGTIVASPEIYRIWGFTPDEDASIAELYFGRVHPEDRNRVQQLYGSCEKDKTGYEADYRIVLSDGTVKHLHTIGHPVLNESGDLVEFSGTTMDVTERHRLERALQHERDRLRLLLDLNNRVASQPDLPQLFQAISTELRRVFKCDFVGLVCPDPSGKYFRQRMVDYPGSKGIFKEGGLYPIDASCSGFALRTGKPFMINDLSEGRPFWSRDNDFSKAVGKEPFQSGCFLPMISAGQVLGVLQVTSLKERFFTQQDREFLEQVAAQITITLKNALQYEEANETKDRLHAENVVLREEIDQAFMFEEIVGSSTVLQTMLSSIVKVAPTDSTVLITGETGTGKELIARAIHKRSRRSGRAFVSVNCASIPSSLVASELFGHEKGAFTGALQQRQGRFELAHSGTIFLDEVGELPAETQIALLRVLQERQFERIGGNRLISTDVRVITATNRDLSAAIAAGTFRSDLFYRLNVFPICVPPLRNRKEDIPMLLEYFVRRFAEKMGKHIRRIDTKTLDICQSYDWPGNIRELQNIIERSVILASGDTFSIDESWLSTEKLRAGLPGPLKETLREQEKKIIEAALAASEGKVAGPDGAAAKLGIPPSTLDSKIRQFKIKRAQSAAGA
jgi:formate hydrogenlyase transcriptional activator